MVLYIDGTFIQNGIDNRPMYSKWILFSEKRKKSGQSRKRSRRDTQAFLESTTQLQLEEEERDSESD